MPERPEMTLPQETISPVLPSGEDAIRRLRESNAALSVFGHAVAHDLKAPLRHIVTYTDMLRQIYAPQLDENGMKFAQRLSVNAARAAQLVEDLLAYAEAAEPKDAKTSVDLNAIYNDTVNDLQDSIDEAKAYIVANDLPKVTGYPSRLRRLLNNLIVNALRYKSAAPPVIGISVAVLENEYLFAVQDNGIGIPAEYQSMVFEPLKRLHSRDEIEGSGLGLAACRSIVQLHGGRIWVESTEGEGATFFFTLPKP
jgi:light-regulated signal transduction histidine kinase (bacteriophytochrome)